MSRDWTPEEIQRVSAAMKESGNMSYEEFCNDLAKTQIEQFASKQQTGSYPCPRCGAYTMSAKPIRNALSRYADIYVCDTCGMDEAIRAYAGKQLPLVKWKVYTTPSLFK